MKKFVIVIIFLFCVSGFTQTNSTETLAQNFFARLSPCEIYDFTLPIILTRDFIFDVHREMSVREIRQLADEFTWGGRWAKYYYPSPTINRYQTEKSMVLLADVMDELGIAQIALWDLKDYATQKLESLKKSRVIGECYVIQTKESPLIAAKRTISIPPLIQDKIDLLFAMTLEKQQIPLSAKELHELINSIFTLDEILELRAIRKATEIFEKNTVLKNDSAGGVLSNLRGEIFGEYQLACTDEAETYELFLKVLERRGLLTHFYASGQVSMRPPFKRDWVNGGHVATSLTSERTGEHLVLDSWYEPGGTAAHILTEADWRNFPVTYIQSISFNDVVTIIDPFEKESQSE